MKRGEPRAATVSRVAGDAGRSATPWAGAARRARGLGLTAEGLLARADPLHIGIALVALALAVYMYSNPLRVTGNFYNHFVWQAAAFLDGRFAIDFPVAEGPHVNAYFQDVMPVPDQPGRGLLPFPPLPALLLVPQVILAGLGANAAQLAVVLGAINVGLCWRMAVRLTESRAAALLATIFFGFGTVHWYAAMLGSTWFLAHVAAITFVLLAITVVLDGERVERARAALGRFGAQASPRRWFDPLQFMAGFLLGLGALGRLPVLLAAPFFVFVGAGGSYRARAFSAGLGALVPVLLLMAYNLASTGHVFNPAYEWLYDLYRTANPGYMPPGFEINHDYAIEDPRHIPLNSLIMFLWPPIVRPECGLEFFARECPLLQPSPHGMSLLLTSPAYLLVVPLVLAAWRQRLVLGTALAVGLIALVNLMHFSQGWVQFGYRFSNDFAPLALVLVTLAIAWRGVRWWTVGLVALSVLINAWGVYWGVMLGW